jgi:two-component system sensor histidine kinase DesK
MSCGACSVSLDTCRHVSVKRQPFSWLPLKGYWGLLLFAVFGGALFVEPYRRGAGALEWTLTTLGVALFLGLFFLVFVQRGRRLLWIAAGNTVLGMLFAPFNSGASILFVYAASFVPFALRGRPWHACAAIGGVVVLLGVESWLLRLPTTLWAVGIGYSLLIGAMNVWVSQQSIASERLQLAHDEIEHLAKIAERERIGRDLHDVLGHTLSVIIVKAELAARLVKANPEKAQAEIVGVEQVSRQALAEVREAIRGYRTHGLLAEIERARSVLEDAGIVVDCRTSAVNLTSTQDNVLALVLREAVTNVIRHADARSCQVLLEEQKGTCRLVVQDDGRGGPFADGSGLRGIGERVAAIGGSVARDDRAGVRLTITVPLLDGRRGV